MKRVCITLGALSLSLLAFVSTTALAHVGSPDVYYEGMAGRYPVLVIVRMPRVVPGLADIEVRTDTQAKGVWVTPSRIKGLGSELTPTADEAARSRDDAGVFRTQLWIMFRGAWKVQVKVQGPEGVGEVAVPIAAFATETRGMSTGLSGTLLALMALLSIGLVAMAGSAAREGSASPGEPVGERSRKGARWAMVGAACVVVGVLAIGQAWWKAEAKAVEVGLYSVPRAQVKLRGGNTLAVTLQQPNTTKWFEQTRISALIPDHGHLMHLFVVRMPAMEQMLHLHPEQEATGRFAVALPDLPTGKYQVFADIVYATGFPETQVAEITLPEVHGKKLSGDDAQGRGGAEFHPRQNESALGAGLRMQWMNASALRANVPVTLQFAVKDGAGAAVTDLEPYMGMAGHLVVMRADAGVFAHLHPNGSPPMASVELANVKTPLHAMHHASPDIRFPYGFPSAGRYRLFVQVKRAGQVQTGAFDVVVE